MHWLIRVAIVAAALCASAAVLLLRAGYIAPAPALQIGRETSFIEGPRTRTGSIDWQGAMGVSRATMSGAEALLSIMKDLGAPAALASFADAQRLYDPSLALATFNRLFDTDEAMRVPVGEKPSWTSILLHTAEENRRAISVHLAQTYAAAATSAARSARQSAAQGASLMDALIGSRAQGH